MKSVRTIGWWAFWAILIWLLLGGFVIREAYTQTTTTPYAEISGLIRAEDLLIGEPKSPETVPTLALWEASAYLKLVPPLTTKKSNEPEIKMEIVAAQYVPPPAPPEIVMGNRGYNHFPWGWCTWYAASRRYVPWYGNAINWWANSAPYRPRGFTPKVGAIMVSSEGDPRGHVSIVESVNPNGSFVVSEMNGIAGFGRVGYRTVWPGRIRIVGFIY